MFLTIAKARNRKSIILTNLLILALKERDEECVRIRSIWPKTFAGYYTANSFHRVIRFRNCFVTVG